MFARRAQGGKIGMSQDFFGKGGGGGKKQPSAAQCIPIGVRHLDSLELARLTEAFRSWAARTSRADVAVSRNRALLTYLIIRHTGARLGETLHLDDLADIDAARLVIRFGDREVQIPEELGLELAEAFNNPSYAPLRGSFFRMDPAHVRRKFYERAKEAGIEKTLVNPNALRRSRAIELLRDNVPLTVVQKILGHSTAELTAAFLKISDDDARRIERRFLERESRKTSARNFFFGKVSAIRRGDIQAEVELSALGGHAVSAIITNASLARLGLKKGMFATAEIKAPFVSLAKAGQDGAPPAVSADNLFPGEITDLVHGKINSEITVALDSDTSLCAILTSASARRLAFAPGEKVYAAFNAFSVILNIDA